MADVRVMCESPEHDEIKSWAVAAIIFYPIGWTATTAVLLFAARKSITGYQRIEHQRKTPISRALSFVHGGYEPWVFWWELLELGRKLFLTGFVLLIPQELTLLRLLLAFWIFC